MPYLAGQACSIHGFVTSNGAAVFRPVLLDISAHADEGRFEYVGCDTAWEPARLDSEEIRAAAAAVGKTLGALVGFRGAYCIDGILTAGGFRPTEVNTRWGSALTDLARLLPELPLRFVHAFMADGHQAAWKPRELEHFVLARLRGHRSESRAGPTGEDGR